MFGFMWSIVELSLWNEAMILQQLYFKCISITRSSLVDVNSNAFRQVGLGMSLNFARHFPTPTSNSK